MNHEEATLSQKVPEEKTNRLGSTKTSVPLSLGEVDLEDLPETTPKIPSLWVPHLRSRELHGLPICRGRLNKDQRGLDE